jgi:glycosyltransferase involved in cell wall biosynthesis
VLGRIRARCSELTAMSGNPMTIDERQRDARASELNSWGGPHVQVDRATKQNGLYVLHGVLSLEVGGLERLVLDLVKMGRKCGQRVGVVCVEKPGLLAPAAMEMGAEIYCLEKPAGRSAAAVNRAAELLERLRPDVVHTHQTGALYYLGQAARNYLGQAARGCSGQETERVGIPVLHTEHSDHVAHAKSWQGKLRARLLWRQTARWAKKICCVSEDIAASVRRWGTVPAGKVDVVLNGIDTEIYDRNWDVGIGSRKSVREELGVPEGALVVGTVGRLVEVKRQDLLVRAFAKVVQRFEGEASLARRVSEGEDRRDAYPTARLLVVGDGPERNRLQELVRALGLQEHVIFAGYQARPERFYRAMDVFALSSRHEGLPLALLEAWASGVPVVVPEVGGIAKLVTSGQTGLLFPREDETSLAESLIRVLSDGAMALRLAAAGRSAVEDRYSLSRMAEDYQRLYLQLVRVARTSGTGR